MGQKHIRRFRRLAREEVAEQRCRGSHSDTINSTLTIWARHWVRGGPLTPRQALRSLAMVTGEAMRRVPQDGRMASTSVLMWKPAQGETWAGKLRNGWA